MNFFGLNPLHALRRRLGTAFIAVVLSLSCCSCGALMTFVFAPGQALHAYRVSRMPQMDAAAVESAPAGNDVIVTGVLANNVKQLDGFAFVAYSSEEWQVTQPSNSSNAKPQGSWKSVETRVPDLKLNVNGQNLALHSVARVSLSGLLDEKVVPGDSALEADYDGKALANGTRRYRGLVDGATTTVLGKKASSGGIIPEYLFAGDRIAFEHEQRDAASGLLVGGIFTMAMAPVVLIVGLLFALFRRRGW